MRIPRSSADVFCAALVAATALLSSSAQAGCRCGGGSLSAGPLPTLEGFAEPGYGDSVYGPQPYVPVAVAHVPPGTLGRTYSLQSFPVPTNKHPRAGMLQVRVTGATRIIVHDTNEFRTQDKLDGFQNAQDPDVFHFTSEPLTPGLPHIYRVEVHMANEHGVSVQERFVRLIMGRVVFLNI